MVGYGILRKLGERAGSGGLVLAPTRGAADKAWLEGAPAGVTALQADINDPEALRVALADYPPVTHIFYSALVRTSLNNVSSFMDKANVVGVRAMQRNLAPALFRGAEICCCGGTGIYDAFNSMAGCGDIDENVALFKKIFQAVDVSNLRYCCLVTGAKHYGMHLGPQLWPQYQEPFCEHMTEAPGESAYQALEDSLHEFAALLPGLSSLVLRPTFILGPVPRPSPSCMNLSLCLGVYALLCKELAVPLRFLGGVDFWTAHHNFSHSDRVAQLAVNGGAALPLSGKSAQLALNASDHDSFSFAELWPSLSAWAGCCSWEGPVGRNGMSLTYALNGASSERVEEAWRTLAAQHGLREARLRQVLNVAFLEQSMCISHSARLSSQKCKRLSWASPVRDGGWETLQHAFSDLQAQGLLPDSIC